MKVAEAAFGVLSRLLLLCVALCNSSFIGYPMVRALLGEHALPYAVVYDQFGTFVLLSTFGLYVLARYGGDAPPTAREMGLRILKFPPVWALLVGLTLMPEQPPAWIGGALQKLADALLPLVMLAVGLTIQLKLPRDEVKPLAVGLLLLIALSAFQTRERIHEARMQELKSAVDSMYSIVAGYHAAGVNRVSWRRGASHSGASSRARR